MQFTRPHWFASVPRIYEKVYSKVISGAEAKGGAALKIFKWACEVGGQVSDLKIAKKPIPVALGLKYALANKLVFSKIQAALGGRVRWCISGAAPLNQDIGRFFHAAGVLILEGIGMTEDTSFTNLNRYDNYRFGWVGQPGPGVEQKLGEDGEVMFRGRNVMKEYYKMPEETAATITEDGWLLSGDIGEIDDQNFLRITGRKKELIITAGGKNIAPAAIEGTIATSKYINQVFVIGDRRKFLSALVTLDEENVRAWADDEGISYTGIDDLMANEKVQTSHRCRGGCQKYPVRQFRIDQKSDHRAGIHHCERADYTDAQGEKECGGRPLRRSHQPDVSCRLARKDTIDQTHGMRPKAFPALSASFFKGPPVSPNRVCKRKIWYDHNRLQRLGKLVVSPYVNFTLTLTLSVDFLPLPG